MATTGGRRADHWHDAPSLDRVLVAEGGAAGGGELSLVLRDAGWEVVGAPSSAECISMAGEDMPPVAVLSPAALSPPGYEAVARRLRELDPAVGLVLLVEAPTAQLLANALRLGFDEVLSPPLVGTEICAALDEVRARAEQRRQTQRSVETLRQEEERGAGASFPADASAEGARLLAEAIVTMLEPIRPLPQQDEACVIDGGVLSRVSHPLLSRLFTHLECLARPCAPRGQPASVTRVLAAALRAVRHDGLQDVEYFVEQKSGTPRVSFRSKHLRALFVVLLAFAGQRALAGGPPRVRVVLSTEGQEVLVTIADSAGTRPSHPSTLLDFPPVSAGADPLTTLVLPFCRQALEGRGGTLTARCDGRAGITLEMRMPFGPRAPRDWGVDLPADAAGDD